jgi:hypothetical protein
MWNSFVDVVSDIGSIVAPVPIDDEFDDLINNNEKDDDEEEESQTSKILSEKFQQFSSFSNDNFPIRNKKINNFDLNSNLTSPQSSLALEDVELESPPIQIINYSLQTNDNVILSHPNNDNTPINNNNNNNIATTKEEIRIKFDKANDFANKYIEKHIEKPTKDEVNINKDDELIEMNNNINLKQNDLNNIESNDDTLLSKSIIKSSNNNNNNNNNNVTSSVSITSNIELEKKAQQKYRDQMENDAISNVNKINNLEKINENLQRDYDLLKKSKQNDDNIKKNTSSNNIDDDDNNKSSIINSLSNELKFIKNDLLNETDLRNASDNRIIQLENELLNSNKINATSSTNISDCNSKIISLEAMIERLSTDHESMEKRIIEKNKEIKMLKIELEEFQSISNNDSNNILSEENKSIIEVNSPNYKELYDKSNKELELSIEKCNRLDNGLKECEEIIKDRENIAWTCKAENSELLYALDLETDKNKKSIILYDEMMKEHTAKIMKMRDEMKTELENCLHEYEIKIEKIKLDNLSDAEASSNLASDFVDVNNKLDLKETELESVYNDNKRIKNDLLNIQKQYQELIENNKTDIKEVENNIIIIDQLNDKYNIISLQFNEKENENINLQNDLQLKLNEILSMKSQLDILTEENNKIKECSSKNSLQDDNIALLTKNQELMSNITHLDKEILLLKSSIENINVENKSLIDNLQLKNDIINKLKSEINNNSILSHPPPLSDNNVDLIKANEIILVKDNQINELKQNIIKLDSDLINYKSNNDDLIRVNQLEIIEKDNQINTLKQNIIKIEKDIININQAYSVKQNQKIEENSSSSKEIASLKQQLNKVETESRQLHQVISQLRQVRRTTKEDVDVIAIERNELKILSINQNEELEKLKFQLSQQIDLIMNVEGMKNELLTSSSKETQLCNDLEVVQRNLARVEKELYDKETLYEMSQSDILILKQDLSTRSLELHNVHFALHQLEKERAQGERIINIECELKINKIIEEKTQSIKEMEEICKNKLIDDANLRKSLVQTCEDDELLRRKAEIDFNNEKRKMQKTLEDALSQLRNSSDDVVDRVLISNLIVSYFRRKRFAYYLYFN